MRDGNNKIRHKMCVAKREAREASERSGEGRRLCYFIKKPSPALHAKIENITDRVTKTWSAQKIASAARSKEQSANAQLINSD